MPARKPGLSTSKMTFLPLYVHGLKGCLVVSSAEALVLRNGQRGRDEAFLCVGLMWGMMVGG